MSRYTRALRKQARAQAQLHQKQPVNTGSTTLLDEPETTSPGSPSDVAGSDFDPGDSWTPAAPEVAPRPDQVQALAPVAKTQHPGSGSPTRPVLPGREVAPETGPGQRRQPHNEGWLWRDKIRSGDLVVIVGEECSGKTRVLTDWIARVTAGQPFPGISEAGNALPPSDVLVFNCIDDFQHSILDQVKLNGGNPDRVLQASTQLLDWGHSHSEFPDGNLPVGGGDRPEPRVRLHTQEILRKLEQFLLRRPSIRLVVIDQLKQHLKFDSERVFEELIYELQILARHTEVAFILTQRPDAFRNASGIKQYFKSDSLTSVARSIWRVAAPEDPHHGDRVLECLKLNYGVGKTNNRHPWRLWQEPGEPLRWEVGNGQEFPLSKLDAKQRLLFHAKTFISLYLQMFGGVANFDALRHWGRKEGITGAKLMEAVLTYNFGYHFEGCPDSDSGMRQVIGEWDDIKQREAIPEAERPPLLGPPVPKRRKKPAGPPRPEALPPSPVSGTTTPAAQPTEPSPSPEPAPRPTPTPAQALESLRARVTRGEARLKEFDLQGFRFIKPNLAACHLLLSLEAEEGSEALVLEHFEKGLIERGRHTPADLRDHLEEVRRLLRIAHQVDAP